MITTLRYIYLGRGFCTDIAQKVPSLCISTPLHNFFYSENTLSWVTISWVNKCNFYFYYWCTYHIHPVRLYFTGNLPFHGFVLLPLSMERNALGQFLRAERRCLTSATVSSAESRDQFENGEPCLGTDIKGQGPCRENRGKQVWGACIPHIFHPNPKGCRATRLGHRYIAYYWSNVQYIRSMPGKVAISTRLLNAPWRIVE